jgi:hypothetical protein
MTSRLPLSRVAAALALTALTIVSLGLVPVTRAHAVGGGLPLGDAGLPETRHTRMLASGVSLTTIVRGTGTARADQIDTTTRGPWVIQVITIDPHAARGHLEATYGPDLAHAERTTDLVRLAGALAGVNASFFTFTASPAYPGEPVGLGVYRGTLDSEPTADPAEADLVVDAAGDQVLFGHLRWSASLRNRTTGAVLPLEFVNHPPVVPAGCAALTDQTRCTLPGDVALFTPAFAATTPPGPGVEVVLDQDGCVVRSSTTRGTALAAGQTSIQATGQDAATLSQVVGGGCVDREESLANERGETLPMSPSLFAVNGRYRLTAGGQIVVPGGSGSFFARNPRTLAGTTRDGRIVLATIDGRQTTSVGATLHETAAVAQALGLQNAVNLDGGGSTAMSVGGTLINRPSGPTERAVGDALVYIDAPYTG